MNEPSPPLPASPSILAALSQEHRALADANAVAPIEEAALRSFIERVQQAGSEIEAARDRATASRIMRYWAAEAIGRGIISLSQEPPMLAPFRAIALPSALPPSFDDPPPLPPVPETPLPPDPDEIERIARSRKLIRLAALAREWRVSGGQTGYLLNGDALTEARLFVKDDEDIAALVAASDVAAMRGRRSLFAGMAAAILTLVLLLSVVTAFWLKADTAREQEKQARQQAEQARDAADGETTRAKTREAQLNERVRQLSERAADLQGKLQTALRQLNAPRDGNDPLSTPAMDIPGDLLNGYQPDFLSVPVPLPSLSTAVQASAYKQGQPIKSMNYSVVLDASRRVALYTASNYDQSQTALLPLLTVPPHLASDVDADAQPDPAWFKPRSADIEAGRLVTGTEIAWGAGVPAKDPSLASRLVNSAVSAYPNIVPQFDSFRQGLWAHLQTYATSSFNPGVSRISIFSGPILSGDDPMIDGLKLPRSYWKVLVSTNLNAQSDLQVEAYIVPQVSGDGTQKVAADLPFEKNLYQVSVRDIERLTGLDFGPRLREAGQLMSSNIAMLQQRAPSAGQTLAGVIAGLDHADAGAAEAIARRATAALGDGSLPTEADQRPVLQAMVTLAQRQQFAKLSPDARASLLTALAAVPKAMWDQENFRDLKASARRGVADIGSDVADGKLQLAAGQDAQLQSLHQNLDWAVAQDRTVYLQFAGMTREAANDIMTNLKALGWALPGAERTGKSAGYNEVRFAPPDDAAGRQLVDDLRAIGRYAVQARPTSTVNAGNPEIWLSD